MDFFVRKQFISAMLVFFALLSPLALPAAEQYNKEFSFELRDVTVRDVFHYIEKNSEYVFLYASNKNLSKKVNVDVENKNVSQILDEVLEHTGLVYEIDGKQIIVKERNEAVVPANMVTQQQSKSVSGLLTDVDGNPVVGATVVVKGTTNGVTTDIDGRYTLKDVKNGDIIQYSFIGFNTEEREFKGEATINIRMMEASVGLEDVVIIGYGQQKKSSVVSSLNTITSKELQSPGRNLSNNIAGQIAGVLAVQRSGEPGNDNSSFWIRGISSFKGGTDPLVLVDGVPRSMNDITPDEIESFTVLKDAAATAVYGAEGANGVVLITSKRGTTQKPTLDVRVEAGAVSPTRLPKLLNSYEFLSLYNEANWEAMGNPNRDMWVPNYSDEVLELYRTHADPDLYPDTDWLSLLKDVTFNQKVTLNLRGGSERVKYFVSGSFYNEDGIFESDAMDKYNSNINLSRYNIRSNIDIAVTKTTNLAVDMSGQYLESSNPAKSSDEIFQSIFKFAPFHIPMKYSDGKLSNYRKYPNYVNPYNLLNEYGYTKQWNAYIQSKVTLNQELDFITKGLNMKLSASFDANFRNSTTRTKTPTSYYLFLNDQGEKEYLLLDEGNPDLTDPKAGSMRGTKQIYLEGSLNYDRVFADVHDVHGTVLYMQKERQSQSDYLPYRKQSVVSRLSYGYDNRYMIEGSFGLTGSENFAKGYRFGIFPAVGVAWYASNEKFMAGVKNVINKLKFRVSWGLTGNDDVGADRFPYRGTLNRNAPGYSFGFSTGPTGGVSNTVGGVTEALFEAPYLSWEVEEKRNIGLDLGLFNGRVDMSVDFFMNDRREILMQRRTMSSSLGFREMPWQNYGKVNNKGFDGNIVFKQNIDKVMLTFRGNVTYAKNRIDEYDEVPPLYDYQAITGHSLNKPFLYIADGLYRMDEFDIVTDPDTGVKTYTLKAGLPKPAANVKPGDIKYRDLNEDGVIDQYDRTYNHDFYSENPEWVYGFGLSGEWKGFYAGVFFQGVANASIDLSDGWFIPFVDGVDGAVRHEALTSHWSSDDPDNMNVMFPRLYPSNYTHNGYNSTWWYRSGNFLRLKNVEFGYEFDNKVLAKHWIKRARIYVQGNNLTVWDDIKMWDPELGSAGGGAKYPLNRTWTLGIELGF